MHTEITPDTAQVGDRVVALGPHVWSQMIPPSRDFTIQEGELGTVVSVDRQRWYVMVRWDDAPQLPSGEQQLGAHHYMPNFQDNGWDIAKVVVD